MPYGPCLAALSNLTPKPASKLSADSSRLHNTKLYSHGDCLVMYSSVDKPLAAPGPTQPQLQDTVAGGNHGHVVFDGTFVVGDAHKCTDYGRRWEVSTMDRLQVFSRSS